jgi:uroporphyrinogen-III synthase
VAGVLPQNYTILISPGVRVASFSKELAGSGVRLIAWPAAEITPLENYHALDEAIDNLFGYDWLLFRNTASVEYFLRRFRALNHEISELDSLRVCAVNDSTAGKLGAAEIHVDVVPEAPISEFVLRALEAYVSGPDQLHGLNFLVPRGAVSSDPITYLLEEAGARVDVIDAYRTVAADDLSLVRLGTLLEGGATDCVFFQNESELRSFADLFDVSDFGKLLKGILVAYGDSNTARVAADFNLNVGVVLTEPRPEILIETIARELNPP